MHVVSNVRLCGLHRGTLIDFFERVQRDIHAAMDAWCIVAKRVRSQSQRRFCHDLSVVLLSGQLSRLIHILLPPFLVTRKSCVVRCVSIAVGGFVGTAGAFFSLFEFFLGSSGAGLVDAHIGLDIVISCLGNRVLARLLLLLASFRNRLTR